MSILFAVMWNPIGAMLLAINRHEAYSYTFGLAAIACVGLTYFLVERFGVTGAAMANLSLDLLMLTVAVASLRRQVGKLELSRGALAALLPRRWRSGASG